MKKALVKCGNTILCNLNVPHTLSNHLVGKNHKPGHRMAFGVVIMGVGVTISKMVHSPVALHMICDLLGYGVHGIGLIPFVEHILKVKDAEDAKANQTKE